MSLSLVLNPMVGVAPGTTTMQLGCCTAGVQLGACPPDYYPGGNPGMPMAIMPSTPGVVMVDPYGSEAELKGLSAPTFRWDILAFAIGLGFAATLGYLGYNARKRST